MYFAISGSKTLPTMIRVETKKGVREGLQFIFHYQGLSDCN